MPNEDDDILLTEHTRLDTGPSCLEQIIDDIIQDESSLLYCLHCRQAITSLKEKRDIRGRFLHERINPEGFQFLIGCFNQALGCDISGKPSPEYTWFEGFHWQQCLCCRCQQHLGWYFSRQNEHFFALIMKSLTQHGL